MADIDSKNLLVAVKSFARANPLPLDKDEVWASLEEANAYIKTPTAYEGQTIKVLEDGKYVSYNIDRQEDGNLVLTRVGGSDSGIPVTEEDNGKELRILDGKIQKILNSVFYLDASNSYLFQQVNTEGINKWMCVISSRFFFFSNLYPEAFFDNARASAYGWVYGEEDGVTVQKLTELANTKTDTTSTAEAIRLYDPSILYKTMIYYKNYNSSLTEVDRVTLARDAGSKFTMTVSNVSNGDRVAYVRAYVELEINGQRYPMFSLPVTLNTKNYKQEHKLTYTEAEQDKVNNALRKDDAEELINTLTQTVTENIEKLDEGKADKNHASDTDEYGAATTTKYGHVKLSQFYSGAGSAEDGVAASPYALSCLRSDIMQIINKERQSIMTLWSGYSNSKITIQGSAYLTGTSTNYTQSQMIAKSNFILLVAATKISEASASPNYGSGNPEEIFFIGFPPTGSDYQNVYFFKEYDGVPAFNIHLDSSEITIECVSDNASWFVNRVAVIKFDDTYSDSYK